MRGTRILLALTLAASSAALAGGCSDDDPAGPGRDPEVLRVPIPYTFEEAAARAIPGDTILINFATLPLSATVTIRSEQTPLVVTGNKNYPVLAGPAGAGILRFVRPRAGTLVKELGFDRGEPAISVSGAGGILVDDCRFFEGDVQILASGAGLELGASGLVMQDAGLFAIDVSGAVLEAASCTIDRAGDCAIRLQNGAAATVTRSILSRSANYGIACFTGASLADTSGCNDVFDSGTAPYGGCAAPATDFDRDPLFCDSDRGIYSISSASPCSPDSSGGCGLIGALPVGCEP
jgi:hypothetical protein